MIKKSHILSFIKAVVSRCDFSLMNSGEHESKMINVGPLEDCRPELALKSVAII